MKGCSNTVKRARGQGHMNTNCAVCQRRVRVHMHMDGPVAEGKCSCGAVVRIVPPTGDWYIGAYAEAWDESDDAEGAA